MKVKSVFVQNLKTDITFFEENLSIKYCSQSAWELFGYFVSLQREQGCVSVAEDL